VVTWLVFGFVVWMLVNAVFVAACIRTGHRRRR
jgi:hypothetical protein